MKKKSFTSIMMLVLTTVTLVTATAQNQDDLLFRRRVISSGFNSFLYGSALVAIVEPESDAAIAGIPIIAAGLGALVPVLINEKYPVTINQQILTTHGQLVGWVHGGALSLLIMGENIDNGNNAKVAVALAAAGSIGMGVLGKNMGKTKPWSEGQAAMMAHMGWVGPLTTTFTALSFSDDPRVVGAFTLLGGAGGYLTANAINRKDQFTRGDVRAISTLSLLNGGLGTCIYIDAVGEGEAEAGDWGWLCPVAGVLSGSFLGQAWLKNAELTPRQGMNVIWATTGGAVVGLGVAMLINSDSFTPWYTITYATSLGSYALAVGMMKNNNSSSVSLLDKKYKNWNFSLMPQNYFLNEKISKSGYTINGQKMKMQPLFSASVTF